MSAEIVSANRGAIMATCEVTPHAETFRPARLLELVERAKNAGPVHTAVCWPTDELSLAGALDAEEQGLIVPYLVGPTKEFERLAGALNRSLKECRIVHVLERQEAARRCVEMCHHGPIRAIMKGHIHTDELLHAVLVQDGSKYSRWLSHIFVAEVPRYDRLLLISDAAVNIHPSLDEKRRITQNAIAVAKVLGIEQPKVAVLSAVETVESEIFSTVHAAALAKMAEREQIQGAIVDGPLAFDVAVCSDAAKAKGLNSAVAGKADVLIAPNLEAGNILAKQLEYLSGASMAGVVCGAEMPIILTSRSDSRECRVLSCAVAVLMSERNGTRAEARVA